MRTPLFLLTALVAVVVGWLLARHFVGSGHPYVAVVVMFVIGLTIGAMLMSVLRGVARSD